MKVNGQLTPLCFTPEKTAPITHCVGGSMVPRTGLNIMENRNISCPNKESNPKSSEIQPVA
jgi:hypothetical protein